MRPRLHLTLEWLLLMLMAYMIICEAIDSLHSGPWGACLVAVLGIAHTTSSFAVARERRRMEGLGAAWATEPSPPAQDEPSTGSEATWTGWKLGRLKGEEGYSYSGRLGPRRTQTLCAHGQGPMPGRCEPRSHNGRVLWKSLRRPRSRGRRAGMFKHRAPSERTGAGGVLLPLVTGPAQGAALGEKPSADRPLGACSPTWTPAMTRGRNASRDSVACGAGASALLPS
jgi:hypothetical protein